MCRHRNCAMVCDGENDVMKKIKFFDATLRDGSHAVKHQLSRHIIEQYCRGVDGAGLHTVIVGHGNGIGASSLQVGLSLLSDECMLRTAKENLRETKLGVYMIPGFGTIEDDILPAIELGVDLFKIGCHCTEANLTRQHIEYVCDRNKEVYGVLMMYHMADIPQIVEEAKKMQSYGADGIILMDSAGTSMPEHVKRVISALVNCLDMEVGFHSHNNMGLAIINAYTAVQEGADIIDGTIRGFGAGAGNCQLEVVVGLLKREGYDLDMDLYQLFDVGEDVIDPIANGMGLAGLEIVSGMAGVFSAFKPHVLNAAKEFHVDPRDIFMELGKKKVVAGQEDMIVEVAAKLAERDAINHTLTF